MGIHRLENSVNPLHLVTPERVVVPMPKGFDSPAGIMPFHRMLEAQNQVNGAQIRSQRAPIVREPDSFEPTSVNQSNPVSQSPDTQSPKLGEVSPVEIPAPQAPPTPAPLEPTTMGGLLDIYL